VAVRSDLDVLGVEPEVGVLAFERALALPFAGTMTEDAVDRVASALARYA